MSYKFASRISASMHEVDAITEKQFRAWDGARQADYLKKHPTSKFGKQQAPAQPEKRRADDWGLKRVEKPAPAQAPAGDGYADADTFKRAGKEIRNLPASAQKKLRSQKNLDDMLANTPAGPGATRWLGGAGGLLGANMDAAQHQEVKTAGDALSKAYSEFFIAQRDREGPEVVDQLKAEFEQAAKSAADALSKATGTRGVTQIPASQVLLLTRGVAGSTPKGASQTPAPSTRPEGAGAPEGGEEQAIQQMLKRAKGD